MSATAELLEWVSPARNLPDSEVRDLPDSEVRVLLWLRQADGACDWDVGHWTGEGWLLDWCGAAPEGEVLAWAQPEGPAA